MVHNVSGHGVQWLWFLCDVVVHFPEDMGFYVTVFLGLLEVSASPKLDFLEGMYLHYVRCNFSVSGVG
jgi:hypothetical protein